MDEVLERPISSKAGPPSPTRWKGRHSLTVVHEQNERCFSAFALLASGAPGDAVVPCVAQNRELWTKLDREALQRAAHMPFVVVDVCFRDAAWYRATSRGEVASEVGGPLAQEIVMFAWQTARWDRLSARMMFGMSAEVAEVIAGLAPRDVRIVAQHAGRELKMRWQEDAQLWGDWLTAANDGHAEKMESIRRHLELRFCGELW